MADSKKIDDGGPAFPVEVQTMPDGTISPVQTGHMTGWACGVSVRDWFAAHAPEPCAEDVKMQMEFDRSRNPHNDYHKAERRSTLKVIADLKFAYADAMIAARKAGG
jgi:hypothetical protein